MDTINRKFRLTALLFVALFAATGAAQTSSFTYQGRLTDGGGPANGPYQMQFTLFPSAVGGDPLGPTIQIDSVEVANGVFTVQLNFTALNAFNGGARQGIAFDGANLWVTNTNTINVTRLFPAFPQ